MGSRRACDVGSFASNLGFESLIIVLDHLRNQPKVIRSLELLFLLVELSWPSIIRLKQLFVFIFKIFSSNFSCSFECPSGCNRSAADQIRSRSRICRKDHYDEPRKPGHGLRRHYSRIRYLGSLVLVSGKSHWRPYWRCQCQYHFCFYVALQEYHF